MRKRETLGVGRGFLASKLWVSKNKSSKSTLLGENSNLRVRVIKRDANRWEKEGGGFKEKKEQKCWGITVKEAAPLPKISNVKRESWT